MSNCTRNRTLISRFDNASDGNVVQCGEIGGIGGDTTFTVALGYGGDAATALAAAEGSLAAGFPDRETAYRKGWKRLRGRAAPCIIQCLVRHAAPAGLLYSGDGAARSRGQDIPRRQRSRIWHALGRFSQWGPAE